VLLLYVEKGDLVFCFRVFLLRSLFAKMGAALSEACPIEEYNSRKPIEDPLKRLEDVVLNGIYITDEEVRAYEKLENKGDYVDKYWKLGNKFRNLREFFNRDSANFIGYWEGDIDRVLGVYDRLKSKYSERTFKDDQVRADYDGLMEDIEGHLKKTCEEYKYVLDLEMKTDSEVKELIKILNYDVEWGEQKDYAKYWKIKDQVEFNESGRVLHKGRITLLRDKIKEMKGYGRMLPETVQDMNLFSKEIGKLARGKLSRYKWDLYRLKREVDELTEFKSKELKIPLDYLKSDKRVMEGEFFLMEGALNDFTSRFETYFNYPDPIGVYRVARSFFCLNNWGKDKVTTTQFKNICEMTEKLLGEEKETMLDLAGDQEFMKKIGFQFLRVLHNRLDRGHRGITRINDLSRMVEEGRFNEFFGEEEKGELVDNLYDVIGKRNGNPENSSRLLVYCVVNCSVRDVGRFLADQDNFLNRKEFNIKDASGTFGRYFGQVVRMSINSPDLFEGLVEDFFIKTRKKLEKDVCEEYGPSAFERLDELVTH